MQTPSIPPTYSTAESEHSGEAGQPLHAAAAGTADPTLSLLESERRAHEAFGATRRRAYVEISSYLDRLDAYLHDGGPPLVVMGDSGAGKSALVAYWIYRLRGSDPNAFVIAHHVGAAASGGDHTAMLRRVMAEIGDRYGVSDPIPTDPLEIEQGLAHWLGHVQREQLVIVIDALNQLDEESQTLDWLPEYLQPNIRLVLTTSGGDTLHQLRRRDLPHLQVQPLTLQQRNEVMRRYLDDFGRRFGAEQLQRVSSDSSSANPLFLRTRLEELRRSDSTSNANELIDYYLGARNLEELFQRVLMRLENDHGADLVAHVMTLVWGSRRGLYPRELEAISGARPAPLAALLRGLEFHLMSREGLLAFFHDQFREAVWNRYLAHLDSDALRDFHLRIARHFSGQPISPRRLEEEPWQLARANAWDALRDCISALPLFMAMVEEGTLHSLRSYWVAIGDRHDLVASYLRQLEAYGSEADTEIIDPVLHMLGRFFSECGRYDAAESIARRSIALRMRLRGPDHIDTADSLDTLATILYHTRNNREALDLARRALAIRERSLGGKHPIVAKNLADLGAILFGAGSFQEANEVLERALAVNEAAGRAQDQVAAMILNNLGAIRIAMNRPASAITYIERALHINERLLGPEHPEVASNLVNIAFALQAQENTDVAEHRYLRALSISEKTLGPNHPEIAVTLTNLGMFYRKVERIDDAGRLLRRALAVRVRAFGDDNVETLQSMFRVGNNMFDEGNREEAGRLCQRSLAGLLELFGPDDPQFMEMRAHVDERMQRP